MRNNFYLYWRYGLAMCLGLQSNLARPIRCVSNSQTFQKILFCLVLLTASVSFSYGQIGTCTITNPGDGSSFACDPVDVTLDCATLGADVTCINIPSVSDCDGAGYNCTEIKFDIQSLIDCDALAPGLRACIDEQPPFPLNLRVNFSVTEDNCAATTDVSIYDDACTNVAGASGTYDSQNNINTMDTEWSLIVCASSGSITIADLSLAVSTCEEEPLPDLELICGSDTTVNCIDEYIVNMPEVSDTLCGQMNFRTAGPSKVNESFKNGIMDTIYKDTLAVVYLAYDDPNLLTGIPNCPGSTYEIIFAILDSCDRVDTCTQLITIGMNDEPTIDCTGLGGEVACDPVPGVPAYTTSCGVNGKLSLTGPVIVGDPNCPGTTYTYTHTVTDTCGRDAMCDEVFTIVNDGPMITTCPADMELTCADDIVAGTPEFTVSCDSSVVDIVGPTLVEGTCTGETYTITYTVTDGCGRSDECVQTITIVPVLSETACDDMDPCTENDMETLNVCTGIICVPCAGTPVAACTETIVQACDDMDPCTENDMETLDACDGSVCVPCAGTPVAACTETTVQACDDLDPCTENDMETIDACDGAVCVPCAGTPVAACTETTVQACDDMDPCTENDMETIDECDGSVCVPCAGTPVAACTETTVQACDDMDPCTENDMETLDACDGSVCVPCAGTPVAACTQTTVQACDDLDPCTENDMETIDECDGSVCVPCAGTPIPVCTNTIVQACDDGIACTENDMETIDECDGSVCIPCAGTPVAACTQTTVQACDDNNPCTENDMETIDDCDGSVCVPCAGTPIAACTLTSSRSCDDGDPCTENDILFLDNCTGDECVPCAGTPIPACTNTTVQACDDMDPCTENDMETINDCDGAVCVPCAGTPVAVCTETAVQACDDMDPCTENDMETIDACDGSVCVPCAGTPVAACTETTVQACDDMDCNTEGDTETIDACTGEICVPCAGTPITPPDCNDDDCSTDDSYDAANCMCVNTPVTTLEINCPAAPAVTYDCIDEVPEPDVTLVEVLGFCNDVTIDFVVTDNGGLGCADSPLIITHTYTVMDAGAEQMSCAVDYTVIDDIAPVVTPIDFAFGDTVYLDCKSAADEFFGPESVMATDNCGKADVQFLDLLKDEDECTAFYQCSWSVYDECGNSTSGLVCVILTKNTIPEIACPADVEVACGESISPVVTGVPIATGCSDEIFITSLDSVVVEGNGCETIYRTWTAVDHCDNVVECTQTITIVDDIAPVLTCPEPLALSCDYNQADVDMWIASVTATDNCADMVTITNTAIGSLDGFCTDGAGALGPITVTFTAEDDCGNASNCTGTINFLKDVTAPILNCPPDLELTCDFVQDDITNWLAIANATDNCSDVTMTNDYVDAIPVCGVDGAVSVTFTATDACGNESTCSANIIVIDEQAPVLECPAPLNLTCNYTEAEITAWLATVGATDNCATDLTISNDYVAGAIDFCLENAQTINVLFTVADDCGNESQCTGQITMTSDETAPVIDCPANLTLSCGYTQADIDAWIVSVTATDDCPGNVMITSDYQGMAAVECGENGGFDVTFTATDACGNASTCTASVMLNDDVAPEITCPGNLALTCGYTQADIDAWIVSATATDNCDTDPVIVTDYDGTALMACGANGSFTVTFTAMDDCGNSTSCTATVSLDDDIAPEISCAQDLVLGCDYTDAEITTWLASVTATDNCDSNVMIENNFNNSLPMACADVNSVLVTFTATDDCGNADECTASIIINDEIAPSISCPTNLELACDYTASDIDTWLASATATDNCDESVLINNDYPGGELDACADNGIITVTFTATDDCGNTDDCTATITINDDNAPMVNCPADLVLACGAYTAEDITTWLASAGATDDCSSDIVVSNDFDANNLTDICGNEADALVVTFTAEDACGNIANCTANIIVTDDVPPTLICPASLTINCGYAQSAITAWLATAMATDNCSADVTVENDFDTANLVACGENNTMMVTFTASDACGNEANCTAMVTIEDKLAPSIVCPSDLALSCGYTQADIDTWLASVTADDDCDGAVTVINNYVADDIDFCADAGSIDVTFIATDACGNTSECIASITISDDAPPAINCPADLNLSCGYTQTDIDTWLASATATDACSANVTITNNFMTAGAGLPPCSEAGNGGMLVTFTATDDCGNISQCSASIILNDDIAPVINCPDDLILTCGYSPDQITEWVNSVTASDDCDSEVMITNTYMSGELDSLGVVCGLDGSRMVTFTAMDDCGNTTECTAQIILNDDIMPTISLNIPELFYPKFEFGDTLESNCGTVQILNASFVTATDNCDPDVDVEYCVDTVSETDCEIIFKKCWKAVDDCGNPKERCVFARAQKLIDLEMSCPPTATISCEQLPALPAVTGTPTGAGCSNITFDYTDDLTGLAGCNGTGTIVRTWTMSDDCGQNTTCQQLITVVDNTAPELTLNLPDGFTDLFPAFEFGDTLHFYCDTLVLLNSLFVTATDNCDDDVHVEFIDYAIEDNECSVFMECGWVATDDCGNSTTEYVWVFVERKQDAELVLSCPGDVTIGCGEPYDVAALGSATVSGCISGDLAYTDDVTGLTACSGTGFIVRTWTATSSCGDAVQCQQIITIEDNEAPILELNVPAGTPAFEFGDTLFFTCSDYVLLDETMVTASDNCMGLVDLEHNTNTLIDVNFVDVSVENENCYQLLQCVWSASDECGNMASESVFVYIEKAGPLSVVCPPDVVVSCTTGIPDPALSGSAVAMGCGSQIDISYVDDLSNYNDCAAGYIIRTWTATNECGLVSTCPQTIEIQPDFVGTIEIKVLLQGATSGMAPKPGKDVDVTESFKNTDLMRDNLRADGQIPLTEPYTGMPGYEHFGIGGGETTTQDVLNIEGGDAIVDWIFIRVRDAVNPQIIVGTRAALLQRDGDIVDMDGQSSVDLGVPQGGYYISVNHRNHLGVMTAQTYDIHSGATIDFTNPATPTYGNYAQVELGESRALWAGNSMSYGTVIFQGPNNGASATFFDVLMDPENDNTLMNFISTGYNAGDVNMDCDAIYQGNNNDPTILFFNTLFHPLNIDGNPNFIIEEQTPIAP